MKLLYKWICTISGVCSLIAVIFGKLEHAIIFLLLEMVLLNLEMKKQINKIDKYIEETQCCEDIDEINFRDRLN